MSKTRFVPSKESSFLAIVLDLSYVCAHFWDVDAFFVLAYLPTQRLKRFLCQLTNSFRLRRLFLRLPNEFKTSLRAFSAFADEFIPRLINQFFPIMLYVDDYFSFL